MSNIEKICRLLHDKEFQQQDKEIREQIIKDYYIAVGKKEE
jgi:hypothetical protein